LSLVLVANKWDQSTYFDPRAFDRFSFCAQRTPDLALGIGDDSIDVGEVAANHIAATLEFVDRDFEDWVALASARKDFSTTELDVTEFLNTPHQYRALCATFRGVDFERGTGG